MTPKDEVKKYELMLIFSGNLPERDFEKELSDTRTFLKENTNGFFYEETWGRRDFFYSVKRQRAGYYVFFDFEADPKNLSEIRTSLVLNPVILRHLLMVLPLQYDPLRYKTEMLPDEKIAGAEPHKREKAKGRVSYDVESRETLKPEILQPALPGKKEEEQLTAVEKKLEEILENPDIDIR